MEVIKEILFNYSFFTFVYYLSGIVSNKVSEKYKNSKDGHKAKWDVRITSFVHALIVVIWSLYALYIFHSQYGDSENWEYQKIYGTNSHMMSLNYFTLGYFLWDLILCFNNLNVFGIPFLIHAVMCFIAFLTSLYPMCQYYVSIFLLYELSTIFMNIHLIGHICEYDNKGWYKLNKILMFMSFICVRIIIGPYMVYHLFMELYNIPSLDTLTWCIKGVNYIAGSLSTILNYYWLWEISRSVFKKKKEN